MTKHAALIERDWQASAMRAMAGCCKLFRADPAIFHRDINRRLCATGHTPLLREKVVQGMRLWYNHERLTGAQIGWATSMSTEAVWAILSKGTR